MDINEVDEFSNAYQSKINSLTSNIKFLNSTIGSKDKQIIQLRQEIIIIRQPHNLSFAQISENGSKIEKLKSTNESLKKDLEKVKSDIESEKSKYNTKLREYYENCLKTKLEIQSSIDSHTKALTEMQIKEQDFFNSDQVTSLKFDLENSTSEWQEIKLNHLQLQSNIQQYFGLIAQNLENAKKRYT